MENKPRLKRCQKCGYEWHYTGQRRYFSCPNCMSNGCHPDA